MLPLRKTGRLVGVNDAMLRRLKRFGHIKENLQFDDLIDK